ncbi:maestro heat-like repeat-containing protein family member 2B [Ascaphus truei]|uniref:maestro heat-like repeat-containing protein family member 2B n=1 Tax=Ascaphus truei TaxID=8439 RepID=UPI003F59C5A4
MATISNHTDDEERLETLIKQCTDVNPGLATAARGIILEAMTKEQITSDIFPKIACMLLHQIARNIRKDEASAIRTAASALKTLLMQGLAEQDALILEKRNMWGNLQKAETHHDAVILVARVIAKTKPYHMSRFIMGLLPPPYHPPSSTVLAFYTELLCYPELLDKSQQKLIIKMLLRTKPTGKDVEILRIRALGNVCSHIPDKVKKYKNEMQAIIKAGLHNMDIGLEAMKTAGKMAQLLKKKGMGTLYHDALVQCQAYIDYEDPTMRCQAVQLLGELARSTKVNKRGAFSNIVEKSLLYLLYQLQDKDRVIVETAASTLHSCLPFVGCDKTRMVMESEANYLCQQVPTALRCLFPFCGVPLEVPVTKLMRSNQGCLTDITGSLITERPHLISQLLREAASHLGKEPFQTQAVNLIDNIMHVCYEDDYSLIHLEDMWGAVFIGMYSSSPLMRCEAEKLVKSLLAFAMPED